MDNDNQVFELMTKMYAEMQEGFKKVDERFEKVDERFEKVDERFEKVNERFEKVNGKLEKIENIVVQMETNNKEKFGALFDGYKLNSEKLDRIEKEHGEKLEIIEQVLTKHDEVIRNAK